MKAFPKTSGLGTPVMASESGISGVVKVRSFPFVVPAGLLATIR